MKDLKIGVHVLARDAAAIVNRIEEADEVGVDVAWMTSGGVSPDPLAVFAAAAGRTSRIRFGTSIVPTFPRHPLALAQSAVAVDSVAPGRLRLGVGPSHRPVIEGNFGLAFERPLEHLREYVTILKSLLGEGSVSFTGKRLRARAELPAPAHVEVLISALRAGAFRLAGELCDGAISWVCPMAHIRDVAEPAVREGASSAGRNPPPIVAHVPIVVSTDREAVRSASMRQFGFYPRLPFYSAMFQEAGFPEAADGSFSEAMADALIISGDEAAVADRLRGVAAFGAREIVASIIILDNDPAAYSRTLGFLGEMAGTD